jgi:hypothetical protein
MSFLGKKHTLICGGANRPFVLVQIERDEQLLTFQSYMNRVRTPYEQSFSTNPLYYSLDVGPIHIIMLNAVRRRAAFASVLSELDLGEHVADLTMTCGSRLDGVGKCLAAFVLASLHARPKAVAAVDDQAQRIWHVLRPGDLAVLWPAA